MKKDAKKKNAKPAFKGKKAPAKKAPKTKTKVKAKKPAPKLKPAAKPVAKSTRPAGIPEKLRDAALQVLDDRKAEEIMTFDLSGRSSVADYLIIATGRAGRQLAAIAHYLREAFSKLGVERTRVEGLPEGNWVLVDGGDVLVHLFLPDVRRYYDLERIWNGKTAE